jgi:hypothetical protein
LTMASAAPPPPTSRGLLKRLLDVVTRFFDAFRGGGPTAPQSSPPPDEREAGGDWKASRGMRLPQIDREEEWAAEEALGEQEEGSDGPSAGYPADPSWEEPDQIVAGPASPEPGPRYLNVVVFDEGEKNPHSRDVPLRTESSYRLRLGIGRPAKDSIVRDPDEVPVEKLPRREDGHWLEIGVASPDLEVSNRTHHMFLPTEGAAWVCDCKPGGPHSCSPGERWETLAIAVRTGPERGAAHARINLYFQNNVIQSLSLSADVVGGDDPRGRGGIVALTDFTLSNRLADISQLEPRTASIVVNETPGGTHFLVFKGAGEELVAISFGEGQLSSAMKTMRANLTDVHIEVTGNRRDNRLRPGNRKGPVEFREDLTAMARAGYRYWSALAAFGMDRLRNAKASGTETIEIARVPNSAFVFPWAGVYDLPLRAPQVPLVFCPLIERWDGNQPLVESEMRVCPHADEHVGVENVICPFGFWGYRYAIEEPASTDNKAAPLTINASEPFSMAVAKGSDLNQGLTASHLASLRARLPGYEQVVAESWEAVKESLADPSLELAYFYCHGLTGAAEGESCLEITAGDLLEPPDLLTWKQIAWAQVPNHWTETRPLVFLNGCHTLDVLPQSPVNFVDCFSQVGASGVVGTEITLDQAMASEASEVFFEHLVGTPGMGVGEALRRTRLHFLAKGNMLGLAYTAYCRAELALTPRSPSL